MKRREQKPKQLNRSHLQRKRRGNDKQTQINRRREREQKLYEKSLEEFELGREEYDTTKD